MRAETFLFSVRWSKLLHRNRSMYSGTLKLFHCRTCSCARNSSVRWSALLVVRQVNVYILTAESGSTQNLTIHFGQSMYCANCASMSFSLSQSDRCRPWPRGFSHVGRANNPLQRTTVWKTMIFDDRHNGQRMPQAPRTVTTASMQELAADSCRCT